MNPEIGIGNSGGVKERSGGILVENERGRGWWGVEGHECVLLQFRVVYTDVMDKKHSFVCEYDVGVFEMQKWGCWVF